MSSAPSSDSEVNLFDVDSGSETELEIDDSDSDTPEPPPATAVEPEEDSADSEFDDSGSTVLLLSSNDLENDLESDSDVEEVPQNIGRRDGQQEQMSGSRDESSSHAAGYVERPTGNELSAVVVASHSQTRSVSGMSQNRGAPVVMSQTRPSGMSQTRSAPGMSQTRSAPSTSQTVNAPGMSQTSQSESIFLVNEGAGPSHMSDGEPVQTGTSSQSTNALRRPLFAVNMGAGPSQMTAGTSSQRTSTSQSQAFYSFSNHQRQGLSSQSLTANIAANQSEAIPLPAQFIEITSRNTQDSTDQSESMPLISSTNPQTTQSTNDGDYGSEEEEPMEAEVLTLEEPSKNDSLGDFKSPKKPAAKGGAEGDASDEEGETCIICYEPWTNSGLHRLASLRCGHLFGQSCIEKWLKGQGGKCPQCNSKAKKADIRVIYAKALRMVDTTDKDRALKELEAEKALRRKMELEAAQMNLKYQMAMEEVNRMKAQLQHEKARSQSSFTFGSGVPGTSSASNQAQGKENKATSQGQYLLDKSVMVAQNGGCRVISFDDANYSLVVSMPSPNQLFPGYGVKKINAMDLRSTQYVPIHSKMIRDVAFNGRQDGLMLSASIDKSIKITSLTSNTVVQTYQTEIPAWSCTWNRDDVNYIYAGLQNGTVRIYDTRQTTTEVETLNKDGSRCPIVSLNYVPAAPGTSFWSAGLLSGTLEGTTFWEKMAAAEYRPQKQLDGNCTCLNFDVNTRHCLASFRPNKSHPATRHVMCELKSSRLQGADGEALVTCNAVQTMYGGTTMKLLTKSAMFAGPVGDGQLLVAAGDEASSSAFVWDANTGTKAQKLSVNATVLDVCPFRFNRHHYLACLTEKQVKLYRWHGQS